MAAANSCEVLVPPGVPDPATSTFPDLLRAAEALKTDNDGLITSINGKVAAKASVRTLKLWVPALLTSEDALEVHEEVIGRSADALVREWKGVPDVVPIESMFKDDNLNFDIKSFAAAVALNEGMLPIMRCVCALGTPWTRASRR